MREQVDLRGARNKRLRTFTTQCATLTQRVTHVWSLLARADRCGVSLTRHIDRARRSMFVHGPRHHDAATAIVATPAFTRPTALPPVAIIKSAP